MVTRLVQTTCTHNREEIIHNYFRNVLGKKKRPLVNNFDSILLVIAKDNYFFMNCKASWNKMILQTNLQPIFLKCYICIKQA